MFVGVPAMQDTVPVFPVVLDACRARVSSCTCRVAAGGFLGKFGIAPSRQGVEACGMGHGIAYFTEQEAQHSEVFP
jgi:hypothetical protein